MADHDFVPERDMPETFANASPQSQRILRAAAARLQLADEKIPAYFDYDELDANVSAIMLALDFLEWKLTGGEMSDYLRERWDASDSTGRDLIKGDYDRLSDLFVKIEKLRREHPSDIEAKKRIRER